MPRIFAVNAIGPPNENPDRHDLPALGSPVSLGLKPKNMLILPRRAESRTARTCPAAPSLSL